MNGFKKEIVNQIDDKIRLPYILYIPENMCNDARLIVRFLTPTIEEGNLNEILNRMIEDNLTSLDYNTHLISEKLSYPVMVPIIPRIKGFYSSYLGSMVINNDFSNMHGNIEESQEFRMRDIDKQVYYMIKQAIEKLGISKKAILSGYSAGAKFATQFAVLHPDVVEMNISGGTGGLSTLPLKEYKNIKLPYPIGVANVNNFNFEEFKKIRHFFYIGDKDNNNPAIPNFEESGLKDPNGNNLPKYDEYKNIIYKYNEKGELTSYYPECYSDEEVRIIHELYGDDNQKRFKKNEDIYHSLGINSIHKVYEGHHQSIFKNNREIMVNDILNFIKNKNS